MRLHMQPESAGHIEIIHRDDEIVVIVKPPAMLTHSNSFDRHTPTVLMVLGSMVGSSVRTVHRLDRMTSGVMVAALTPDAARSLSEQFRSRSVAKRYLAIVRGHLDDSGTVTTPVTRPATGEELFAETAYTILGRGRIDEPVGRYDAAWFSLVDLILHTGRTHQARRHLHGINHPVLGDNKHGDKTYNRFAAARYGERHLYLRAYELSFDHPASGRRITACAGVPELWLRVLDDMGIEVPETLQRRASVHGG
jgi:tRNA pseudouridine65 synthase